MTPEITPQCHSILTHSNVLSFNLRDEVIYKNNRGLVVFVDEKYIVIKSQGVPGRDYPLLVVFPEDWEKVAVLRQHKND
jgi:hypothetical protein